MKTMIMIAALLMSARAYADVAPKTLLLCAQKDGRPGAPHYRVTYQRSDVSGEPNQYFFSKHNNNPNTKPVVVEIPAPLTYGDAFIVTANKGRSGYFHLYASGEVAVIDVNLFQQRESGINTDGPLTDYVCRKPSHR